MIKWKGCRDMTKKIYITALHLAHGGVEMAITGLSNALVKRGYQVEILCTYNLGEPAYALDERVKVNYLTDVRPNREEFRRAVQEKNLPGIFREGLYAVRVLRLKKQVLKQQFRRIQEGVIISTRNEDSVLLSRYARKNVVKIAQLHHDHRFDRKLLRDFARHYQNIDILTLLTDQLQQEVSEMMKDNRHTRCVTMPNFLPDAPAQTEAAALENQAVAVGRLDPVKGFLRLISLWKPIFEQTGTVLKIIGGGNQRPELEEEITRQGLEQGVILTGSMDHDAVLAEMKKSVFYAMTSVSEGFPFVLIEAMSQGTPVIAYDVRVGPRAIVVSGVNGFLIEDNDEKAFAEKAVLLITDREKRAAMSQAAHCRAGDFSEDAVMAKWETLINGGQSHG